MLTPYKSLGIHAVLWLLVLIKHVPLYFGFVGLSPNLLLLYVIYVMFRCPGPGFLISAIVAGLFNDMVAGNVIGATSMEFAIAAVCITRNAKIITGQPFRFIWLSVLGLITMCSVASAIINYMVLSQWLMDYAVFVNCLVTACFYPAMHMLLHKLWKEAAVSDA